MNTFVYFLAAEDRGGEEEEENQEDESGGGGEASTLCAQVQEGRCPLSPTPEGATQHITQMPMP